MAFFPRAVYNTDASSFTPLFRLLDDFDKYSRQEEDTTTSHHPPSSKSQSQRSAMSHWQPRFDVRETEAAYELHGELPGMSKDNLTIEFPEPQTLIVRGRTERNYDTTDAATAGLHENGAASTESRRNSHQATVEDDTDEPTKKDSEWQAVEKQDAQRARPEAKYWLTERNIGEFSRTFNFPTRVDQEGARAGLRDGILSVVVPKAKKHEPRRIVIN